MISNKVIDWMESAGDYSTKLVGTCKVYHQFFWLNNLAK